MTRSEFLLKVIFYVSISCVLYGGVMVMAGFSLYSLQFIELGCTICFTGVILAALGLILDVNPIRRLIDGKAKNNG